MKPLLLPLALLLTGCIFSWWQQNFDAPHPTSTPPCTPMPMPTGEQIYPLTFEIAPPTNVFIGQPIQIEFSGGILVAPTGQQCGDEFSILFPNQATAEATLRDVQVRIDGEIVHSQRCGYQCNLYLTVQLTPGEHQLELIGVWGAETYRLTVEMFALT
jgi:hypothetical protein